MITEVTPYICVEDARKAIDWYRTVFDAGIADGPVESDDGRIVHVELYFGDARIFLCEESADRRIAPPQEHGDCSVTLHLTTDHVDEFVDRAQRAHGTVERHPQDTPYGRLAVVRDPHGHRWLLNTE